MLCPFASSSLIFPWMYFGKDFVADPAYTSFDFAYRLIFVIAGVALFAAGIFGLMWLLIKARKPENFCLLALAVAPALFLHRMDGEFYHLYKMLSVAFPAYIFGAWHFAGDVTEQLRTHFLIKQ